MTIEVKCNLIYSENLKSKTTAAYFKLTYSATYSLDTIYCNVISGPFWLGARDIGNKSIFRWTDYITAPNPDDPNTIIGSFINYYNYLEQGPLALQMNSALGSSVFAAHSFSISAKAFCQTG